MREALRQASAAGLNTLRTFAHTTDDNFPFQARNSPLTPPPVAPLREAAGACGFRRCICPWQPAAAVGRRGRGGVAARPQVSPGVFNEGTLRALDWLLDEARLHGLRVILSFCDNWKYPGAPPPPPPPFPPALAAALGQGGGALPHTLTRGEEGRPL